MLARNTSALAPGAEDLGDERILAEVGERHPAAFDGEVEQHDLVERVAEAELVDPVAEAGEVFAWRGGKPVFTYRPSTHSTCVSCVTVASA